MVWKSNNTRTVKYDAKRAPSGASDIYRKSPEMPAKQNKYERMLRWFGGVVVRASDL